MRESKPIIARLRYIDQRIREGKFPNARSLADGYEVSERTIQRDIDYLRDEFNAPIEYHAVKRGYYYTEPTFALPVVAISERELFALCVAEKALEHYRATPLYENLKSAFDKIVALLPGDTAAHYSWLNPRISFIDQSHTRLDPAVWETLSGAVITQAEVDIWYQKAEDPAPARRIVHPYHLVSYEGEWYLIAYCLRRRESLLFALSRIRKAVRRETAFVRPESFSVERYLGDNFGITREHQEYHVQIEFRSTVAPYIQERSWHKSQKIQRLPDGGVMVSFTANSLREVKQWVLKWGAAARVHKPECLVHDIREELERALNGYFSPSGH